MTRTIVERAVALRRVDAFRRVPMEQLAQVASATCEETFPAGSVLFREGDPPGGLFVILEGEVALERGGKRFAIASAGEALGTWSLFDEHPRRATARVEEDARVLCLERADFYEVLAENADVVRSLFTDLVSRLHELTGEGAEESS